MNDESRANPAPANPTPIKFDGFSVPRNILGELSIGRRTWARHYIDRSSALRPRGSAVSSNDYGEPKAVQHRRGTQAILNESWPLSDKAGGHARGIEDQPAPINVEVRIEWADDGEGWLPGEAWRWTRSHVFVRFMNVRSLTGFVWVRARDVRRV
jgi:hypothetical protein